MKLAVGICVAVVLLVLAVWIFLILPRIRNAADRELIGVHYAHRGLHGENVPENSLANFPEESSYENRRQRSWYYHRQKYENDCKR